MKKKVLFSGNEAMAASAIAAGCRFYAGYPITPQNELIGYMAEHLPESGGVFIQSESELAAINMVYAAAACGARAMTSSSSPGISLKQEGLSYIAGAQLPAVVVNVMRAGPGLGNIWPAQSDYFQATKGGGHGDYRMIVLAPAGVQECWDLTQAAFALADRWRIGVMLLSDGMIGQMMEPLEFDDETPPPPAPEKPWALTGANDREPNIVRSLYMERSAVERHNIILQKKYRRIAAREARFEAAHLEDAELVVVAYGSTSRIARAVVETLRRRGQRVGFFRPVTLWPFPEKALAAAARRVKKFLVVEMSYGQMVEDVRLAVAVHPPSSGRGGALHGVATGAEVAFYGRSGGGIPLEEQILREAEKLLHKQKRKHHGA